MTDAERVLAMLIHDVRTPLGVAHGYLRLVRGGKLPGAEDRDRALAGTQDALARISRLCQDAGAFLEDPPGPGDGRIAAAQLVGRVTALLGERALAVGDGGDAAPAVATVAVGTSVDRTAEAIVTLLAARASRTPGHSIGVAVGAETLTFVSGPDGARQAARPLTDATPFDPWASSHGLPVIAAHRLLTALGGSIWTGHGLALALTMPMENGNS